MIDNEKRKKQKAIAQYKYKRSIKGIKTQQRYYRSQTKRDASRRWRQKAENAVKHSAHQAVYEAIKKGKLQKKVCEICGEPNSRAHHDNYAEKLEVRWLCQFHHSRHHRENV